MRAPLPAAPSNLGPSGASGHGAGQESLHASGSGHRFGGQQPCLRHAGRPDRYLCRVCRADLPNRQCAGRGRRRARRSRDGAGGEVDRQHGAVSGDPQGRRRLQPAQHGLHARRGGVFHLRRGAGADRHAGRAPVTDQAGR